MRSLLYGYFSVIQVSNLYNDDFCMLESCHGVELCCRDPSKVLRHFSNLKAYTGQPRDCPFGLNHPQDLHETSFNWIRVVMSTRCVALRMVFEDSSNRVQGKKRLWKCSCSWAIMVPCIAAGWVWQSDEQYPIRGRLSRPSCASRANFGVSINGGSPQKTYLFLGVDPKSWCAPFKG